MGESLFEAMAAATDKPIVVRAQKHTRTRHLARPLTGGSYETACGQVIEAIDDGRPAVSCGSCERTRAWAKYKADRDG